MENNGEKTKKTLSYKEGKIYKLVNSVDDQIYIGSTCSSLAKRKGGHKTRSKKEVNRKVYKHLNEIGWDNVDIVLIEAYSCENKDELHKRERHWIDELKPSLYKLIPTRTNKEYKKEYYEENKEKLKQYYEENCEKLKEKVTCECGSIYQRGIMARHKRSKKHQEFIKTKK